jgi:hypothetical protein
MSFEIVPITEEDIDGFWSAVDSVARERKYLAFLEGPPINTTVDFVLENINANWPHFVAKIDGKILVVSQKFCHMLNEVILGVVKPLTHRIVQK